MNDECVREMAKRSKLCNGGHLLSRFETSKLEKSDISSSDSMTRGTTRSRVHVKRKKERKKDGRGGDFGGGEGGREEDALEVGNH